MLRIASQPSAFFFSHRFSALGFSRHFSGLGFSHRFSVRLSPLCGGLESSVEGLEDFSTASVSAAADRPRWRPSMPVTVRRSAKTQPVRIVRKLAKVGAVIPQASGCARAVKEGTRDMVSHRARWRGFHSTSRIGQEAPFSLIQPAPIPAVDNGESRTQGVSQFGSQETNERSGEVQMIRLGPARCRARCPEAGRPHPPSVSRRSTIRAWAAIRGVRCRRTRDRALAWRTPGCPNRARGWSTC